MHRKLLLFLLIICFTPVVISQVTNPCDNYFFEKIYSTSKNTELYCVDETPDKGMIAVGRIGPFADHDALIMKVDPKGNIQWAKQVGGDGDDHFKKVIPTSDGGYMAIGQTNSFGQSPGSIFLVKFDLSGNITWSRVMGVGSVLIDKSFTVIQLVDGGFAITGSNHQFMNELTVIRTDIIGNTIWEKNYNSAPTFSNAPGGIIEENDSLVVSGSYQQAIAPFDHQFIMKIAKADGNVYWGKEWPGGELFTDLYKLNNNYFINHLVNNTQVISKLDISGNVLRTFYLADNINNQFLNFYPTHDDGLIISKRTSPVNIIKAGINDNIQWANEYSFPGTGSDKLTTLRETSTNQIIAGGNTDIPGAGDIFLFKQNEDGSQSICPSTPFNSTEVTLAITSQPFNWNFIHADDPFNNIPVSPASVDVIFTTNTLCESSSTCDLLKISGNNNICSLSDTFSYQFTRTPGCALPVLPGIDNVYARIAGSTDSTVKLIYQKPGTVKLYARIVTTCSILIDSMTINISDNAINLNLGPDIQLCANTSDTINALIVSEVFAHN
jgi:hypothetical protein